MATKHVNDDKGPEFQRAQGRRDGSGPSSSDGGRERNTGSSGAEEHSRVEKGNRGGERQADKR